LTQTPSRKWLLRSSCCALVIADVSAAFERPLLSGQKVSFQPNAGARFDEVLASELPLTLGCE